MGGVGQRVGKATGVDPGPKAELLRRLSVAGGAVELRDHGGAGLRNLAQKAR